VGDLDAPQHPEDLRIGWLDAGRVVARLEQAYPPASRCTRGGERRDSSARVPDPLPTDRSARA
jgi:hypothetical protein